MKNISLVFLFLLLIFCQVVAQTKKKSKPSSKKVLVTKKATPNPTPPVKTALPATSMTVPVESKPITVEIIPVKLGKFETEILAELNLLRRNPQVYLKYVEDYLKTFDGKYFKNDEGIRLASFEGKTPVEEVIEVLKTTNPLPEFNASNGLIRAAADHSQDLVRNNKTGHYGTNGSLPDDRTSLYGTALNGVNENITYGAKTARDIVFTMLIDDGNANRNHRKNLLNPNLKIIGLATGENKAAGLHCVLVLTPTFSDKQ